ncbi:MAG: site-specific DNA-methyltransferase [Actinomycetota bacterium]|nr:site-specific DNA-methyltransferase [Actinomycetota bacterium]
MEEEVVGLPMDPWTKAIRVGELKGDPTDRRVIVDLDPAVDPVLFWAGKRSHREVPLLPLQRNEIVSESRIARIIERARESAAAEGDAQMAFFELEKSLRERDKEHRVEFYTHDEEWKNKLICGDSLQVMESLIQYERLGGRVQTIYFDPPYGIKYDANFQQRVDRARNVDSERIDDVVTIKAFRDTWVHGIHSYLSHLQERLYLCRELLSDSGSVFVQSSDTNVHLVRAVMDEVFGANNFVGIICFSKTTSQSSEFLPSVGDFLLWYARNRDACKYHPLFLLKEQGESGAEHYDWVEEPDGTRRRLTSDELDDISSLKDGSRLFTAGDLCSARPARPHEIWSVEWEGKEYWPTGASTWKTNREGMERLKAANRVIGVGNTLRYVRYLDDFGAYPLGNVWMDTGVAGFAGSKDYAVQTNPKVVARCLSMTSDPGDLVLDITCGRGTTAFCAEQLGRRWITCDTSRVAINVARRWLLSTVFPHYKTRNGRVSSGFEYERISRTTMGTITGEKESQQIDLVDRPLVDRRALRVTGPFEVMTLGRYAIEDWKGYLVRGDQEGLEDYISAICRLYRKDVALPDLGGLVHGVVEKDGVGISVGPIAGRVTGKQIYDAVIDAEKLGVEAIHVLGWAFETNVGEVKKTLEAEREIRVELVMIRPDTLMEGLKATQPDMLFSPLAHPDVEIQSVNDQFVVVLNGVAIFDRKRRTTDYMNAAGGYVAAWYIDEDYDGDCFVDCQMFFDFKKKPAVERPLQIEVDKEEWSLRLISDPFPRGTYRRCAVKVVDVYGNESTIVRDLA